MYQLCASIQAVFTLWASGLSTGCMVDSGYSVTHNAPIFEGYCLPHDILWLDLYSCDLTEHLTWILKESIASEVTIAQQLLVQGIQEKLYYVCLSFKEHITKNPGEVEKSYHIPSGHKIMVQN